MSHSLPFKFIAFDADDTLWANEEVFRQTENKMAEIIQHHTKETDIQEKLYQTEIKNLKLFGYGIKGFMLSMIETAVELSHQKVTGDEIQQIIDLGKQMMQHPIHLLPGVKEVLEQLSPDYTLMLITKGDLFDQETKIARSGLAEYFKHIEIVSEKDVTSYRNLFQRLSIDTADLVMVGNSLKSDILPLVELGAQAVYVPYHTTWKHEAVDNPDTSRFVELSSIRDLIGWLESQAASRRPRHLG